MKTMIVRNIQPNAHTALKVAAAESGVPMNQVMISMITLAANIGSPREAALDDIEFRLVPHRMGEDTPEEWVWKLETWVDGEFQGSFTI